MRGPFLPAVVGLLSVLLIATASAVADTRQAAAVAFESTSCRSSERTTATTARSASASRPRMTRRSTHPAITTRSSPTATRRCRGSSPARTSAAWSSTCSAIRRAACTPSPLIRAVTGLGPLADPAWRVPGIKVLHIADVDYRTTCVQLATCLAQVRAWSQAHPDHVPIPIMLELKRSDARIVAAGGVVAPAWDAAALDALDAEIRSVFAADEMITPDDVRRPGRTLEESVLRHGWPKLRDSRGKVMFLLDNDPGPIRDAYVDGRPNLEGRVLFTNARPGFDDAAFIKRNEPRAANTAQIADLVRRGYYIRTRSDVPLGTVIANDTSMLDAALASGAQLISTDFPQIGMSARYDSDFVAELPDGGAVRCNPVNAPRSCRDEFLEGGPRWSR